jgi:hypothetical protein
LLEKIHEEYIGKINGIQHVHFAAMEPILACIKVSPSVSVNQAFNMNSPPTLPSLALYLSPLHSSVICLLHAHPNLQELNGLCSKKTEQARVCRRDDQDRTMYQGGADTHVKFWAT